MNMDLKNLKFALTALADDELTGHERSVVEQKLSDSAALQIELHIQSSMKRLVKSKLTAKPCPPELRAQILKNIKAGKTAPTVNRLPQAAVWALSSAAVFLIAFLIFQFNTGNNNLLIEQRGADNMIVQASQNFGSILAGKLTPQIVTSNKEKIAAFFSENGVTYQTVIPNVAGCTLLGGVVSDDKGEKLAHHIYADPEGKLIYVFQADVAHFKKTRLLSVSDDLWEEIEKNNVYFSQKDDYSLAIYKNGNNISTIVSNQKLTQLQQELASYNL